MSFLAGFVIGGVVGFIFGTFLMVAGVAKGYVTIGEAK